MLELPIKEIIIFLSVVVLYLAAGIVGVVQLSSRGQQYKRLMIPVVSLAICLEAVLLIFRAVTIKAIPLTGLFESMIVLTIALGLVFLFFSIGIRQVWFGSVMAWVILGLILLAGIVARPASEPSMIASTPWAIAHGIAMLLSSVLIMFATVNAFLYLLSTNRLKQKKVTRILGKVPSIEKLKRLNIFGLKSCFVLITIGVISGFGLGMVNSVSLLGWFADSKIILIVATWIILALILMFRRTTGLKDKTIAYITMVLFVIILFAIIGTALFCSTKHDFTKDNIRSGQVKRINI